MSKIINRKFICNGCGKDRPCLIEVNQEDNNFSVIEDLKCILDETNQTSYNWVELDKTYCKHPFNDVIFGDDTTLNFCINCEKYF